MSSILLSIYAMGLRIPDPALHVVNIYSVFKRGHQLWQHNVRSLKTATLLTDACHMDATSKTTGSLIPKEYSQDMSFAYHVQHDMLRCQNHGRHA